MPDDIENAIEQSAQGPAQASDESGSMQQHPLPDQIAADRYLTSKDATRQRKFPLQLRRIRPGSALNG